MFLFGTISLEIKKYNLPPQQSLFFSMIKEGQIEFSKQSRVPSTS